MYNSPLILFESLNCFYLIGMPIDDSDCRHSYILGHTLESFPDTEFDGHISVPHDYHGDILYKYEFDIFGYFIIHMKILNNFFEMSVSSLSKSIIDTILLDDDCLIWHAYDYSELILPLSISVTIEGHFHLLHLYFSIHVVDCSSKLLPSLTFAFQFRDKLLLSQHKLKRDYEYGSRLVIISKTFADKFGISKMIHWKPIPPGSKIDLKPKERKPYDPFYCNLIINLVTHCD